MAALQDQKHMSPYAKWQDGNPIEGLWYGVQTGGLQV